MQAGAFGNHSIDLAARFLTIEIYPRVTAVIIRPLDKFADGKVLEYRTSERGVVKLAGMLYSEQKAQQPGVIEIDFRHLGQLLRDVR